MDVLQLTELSILSMYTKKIESNVIQLQFINIIYKAEQDHNRTAYTQSFHFLFILFIFC